MDLIRTPHRIYAENPAGVCIAEITFPAVHPGVWDIDHTFVDPSLRGQGAAEQLVRAVIAQAEAESVKLVATCPYAAAWFARHPEYQPLLAQTEK